MKTSSWTLGTKLFLSFLLIVASCVITLYVVMQKMNTYQEIEERFYQRSERMQQLKDLELNALQQDFALIIAASSDQNDKLLIDEVSRRDADNRALLQALKAHSDSSASMQGYLIELENNYDAFSKTLLNDYANAVESGNDELVYQRIAVDGAPLFEALRKSIAKIENETRANITAAQAEMKSEFNQLETILWWVALFLLVVGSLLAWLLSRHISRPIAELSAVAESIAKGQLPKDIQVADRSDEVGRLSYAFAEMTNYLRELVEELNEGINVLASSSEEILTVTNKVASSTQETATAVSEIATTVEEVKQTANVSGEKSKSVLESTEKTRAEAQQGRQSVDETLGSMSEIREQMQAVASSIMRLGEQSQAIGEIVASVGELAEKSNLLGVNASIEAAKAGEAGKGFAIVAQEVKALADQSKDATVQVRNILGEIQRSMNKAVLLSEQSSKAVETGYEQAQASGNVIQMLSERIEENSDMATQIASSSQQQNIGMDQIAQAMENIRQASQDNVSGAHQVDEAAKNLNQLGQKLQALAARFKV
ncbi:methyl-accepting chemotaxis protein [Pseudidiomarina homiensis]|uniref:methyl-accepting chemotaxis protein n=1 Tax=Pseudidiomarina homiensis TaxID=364198 RepID=UPI00215AF5FC|nr:methyl-accepting chemotaxis protein [Pseudidiomarina homiensis]